LSYHSLLFKFWTLSISEPPSAGLLTTYDVHLGLMPRCELPISVNLTFFDWGATGKNWWKSAILLESGQFDPKFQVEGVALPVIFALSVRPMNALQLCRWQFSHEETL